MLMADELVVYTHPMSRGRIARWMLEEIGRPYRAEILGFGAQMKTAAYKALNPMGKVPTLVHDDTIVTECAAICVSVSCLRCGPNAAMTCSAFSTEFT